MPSHTSSSSGGSDDGRHHTCCAQLRTRKSVQCSKKRRVKCLTCGTHGNLEDFVSAQLEQEPAEFQKAVWKCRKKVCRVLLFLTGDERVIGFRQWMAPRRFTLRDEDSEKNDKKSTNLSLSSSLLDDDDDDDDKEEDEDDGDYSNALKVLAIPDFYRLLG
ncbi:uncharacterized protein IWZ02DRAFT_437717 [Phyllosticta citriasiana]|uniref:uncharacterized protein n=1 Tax=Phyllosticta citriasiana TaxID=595635 RepID=UPI0030FD75BD